MTGFDIIIVLTILKVSEPNLVGHVLNKHLNIKYFYTLDSLE